MSEDNDKQDVVADDKLAALKAMMNKGDAVPPQIVSKKTKSIRLGVVGSGQCGARIAEVFHKLGYDAICMNTAPQDLEYISMPPASKLLLEYGVGGASKELEIGRAAAELHRHAIAELVQDKLSDSQVNVLCLSLGGGSGAGSCDVLVELLSELGKPLIVIVAMPMQAEDAHTKSNALETLAKLAAYARTKKIHNLLVVDNAKIESIHQDLNQKEFYQVANNAVVETLDVFNRFSSMPSEIKALDPMEFSKILMDGEGLSVYGELTVENYREDTAIAEAVVNNLNGNLLASGFNLKQSKYVGFIVVANADVWKAVPASSINYATAMINELCGDPKGVFKGIYTTDTKEDVVKVYSFFSGLGLPADRVEQLKGEIQSLQSKIKVKDEARTASLQLDSGVNETVSMAQKVKDKIAQKSSTFGKFVVGAVKKDK
jgi:cell division GTPase FtsZ